MDHLKPYHGLCGEPETSQVNAFRLFSATLTEAAELCCINITNMYTSQPATGMLTGGVCVGCQAEDSACADLCQV